MQIISENLFLLLCLISSTCFLVFITVRFLRISTRSAMLPPGPSRLPIIGNIHQVGKLPHRSFADLSRKYGPIMHLKFGRLNTVIVTSPEAAREVLKTHDQTLSGRDPPNSIRSINHDKVSVGWLHPSSPRWRLLRKLLVTHMFSPQRIEATKALRLEKVQDLVSYIDESSEREEAVHISRASFTTTLNIISNILFSVDLASYGSEKSNEFRDSVIVGMEAAGSPDLSNFFPCLRFLDLQGNTKKMKFSTDNLLKVFRGFIDTKTLEKSLGNNPKDASNSDFLDALLDEAELDNTDIEHLLLDMFTAGTETSSSTLEWAMTELLTNPKTMEKAQAEIEHMIEKNGFVREPDTSEIPYLQAVVKETFRLHPTIPLLLPRKAETDVEVLGYVVPKDAQVLVNLWAIGRDPNVWENPTRFEPERFLGKETDVKGRDFELTPFGAGRRICPGLPLAVKTVSLMLVSLLYSFDWKLPNAFDMDETFGITLRKANPLHAVPVKKNRHYTFLLFCLIASCFLVFITARFRRVSCLTATLPPGPPRLPFIGNIHQVGKNPHRSFADLSKTYGPVMSLKLGSLKSVIISSPEAAREVLRTHDQILSSRKSTDSIRSFGHHEVSVIWLPPSARWRMLRKLSITQLFSPQRMEATKGLRMKKVQELVSFMNERSEKEDAVDISRASFTTVLNIISNILFSVDLGSYDVTSKSNRFRDTVIAAMEAAGKPDTANYFPFLGFLDLQGNRKNMKTCTERLFRVFRGFIDAKMTEKSLTNYKDVSDSDFLDALLVLMEGDETELDNNDIEHLLLDMFAAGTDTSSSTLEWAMAELLNNPKSLARAQAEIDCVIGQNGIVQESDISYLPYLQAVVKETFRLHPAAPFLVPRKAEADVKVLGFMVPKDAQVLVNVWAIGRDPAVWENPNRFEPERFLGKETDVKGRDYELTPFGAGRRICPGLPLAVVTVSLMLASLLYFFDWKLPNGVAFEDLDMDETFGITLHKTNMLHAVPVKKRTHK
ncbi:unnamed protein product [Eruca vesicaria subsp. sativa]|uniref:Cytochrome P450 n=1 Tax=Eruca vesicaria subsp. sativa TaxID=29727 RepID=A0ABC8LTS6_ERUVS|nr:unnamed protein product [Eruca vesicaria subsp. sativa]